MEKRQTNSAEEEKVEKGKIQEGLQTKCYLNYTLVVGNGQCSRKLHDTVRNKPQKSATVAQSQAIKR